MADNEADIDPPWRLSPLEDIINVNWQPPLYVLVWISTQGFGHELNGCHSQHVEPMPLDIDFQPVDFKPTVELANKDTTNAEILYKRVEGIKKIDSTQYACRVDAGAYTMRVTNEGSVVFGGFNIPELLSWWCDQGSAPGSDLCGAQPPTCCDWLTTPQQHGCIQGSFGNNPNPTGCSGGGFAGGYSTGPEAPSPPFSPHFPILGETYDVFTVEQFVGGATGVSTFELNHQDFEGVWLLKIPSVKKTTDVAFTITVQGYSCGITVLVYSGKGIKFDSSNTTSTWNNDPPTGRVYVPLNWSSEAKKPPKDPDGNDWPGYRMIGCPLKDVKNATIFQGATGLNRASGARQYKFVLTKEKHLKNGVPTPSDPPTLYDKSVKDEIVQLYMDDSSSGKPDDQWFGGPYCDVPFGLPFKNFLDPDSYRGPLVKVDKDEKASLSSCS